MSFRPVHSFKSPLVWCDSRLSQGVVFEVNNCMYLHDDYRKRSVTVHGSRLKGFQ